MQKQLTDMADFIVRNYSESTKLRGMTALWKEDNHTVCLTFYFDGQISDEDLEDAYDIGAGIIAHFPDGFLEEKYIRWDYPKPLPEKFLAYKKEEEIQKINLSLSNFYEQISLPFSFFFSLNKKHSLDVATKIYIE